MHPKKEQKKKLDLNLSAAELPYLKQYFEAGHFGSLKPPKEETKIVGISVILREWLDEKTEAFEGLTAEEIEKMKEILQRIYPNEGIESVFSYDDFEESDEKPLIRKPKGQTIAERLERQFSNAEKSQADEEATNSEFDDLCRNKFQLNRCENLYKMVEDDLEAIKSDAESRAHLGIELKKFGTEDLDEFLQNLSADDLDWLRTELEMSHEQNLPATYKKTEDGQKVASYLEWKKMTESSEEKRHDDGLDGPISDAEWEEATTHPNDAITAAIQDNATTIEQQRPGGFLNRQINRLSSALTGIMVTAEAEQEPEQQSYFEHLEHFLLDYDNWFHYHGLEECDDANNAQ
uniref:Uncharacterized protein n=1 Tax=Globodera rostochiensis TaxID=31243 RepID=A0A914H0W7_GLORO